MGRPKKDMKRKNRIIIRLNDKEYEKLLWLCEVNKCTKSKMMRWALDYICASFN